MHPRDVKTGFVRGLHFRDNLVEGEWRGVHHARAIGSHGHQVSWHK